MILMHLVQRVGTPSSQNALLQNYCCDQDMSVPFYLCGRYEQILANCNVQATVQNYMTSVQNNIISDTFHLQI